MLPEEGVVLPRRGQGKSGVIRQVKRICPAPVTDALAKKMGADTLAQYRELCRDKLLKAEKNKKMQGLGLANEVLDSWLYGGDPAANLSMAPLFEELNALVDTGWYFRNYSYEDRCALRKAVLDATTDNFAALAGELRKACEESAVCVVGPASLVEVCQPERMSYL